MTNLYMPKDELVRIFVAQATALRDQDPGASAEDLAETARTVARRQPSYRNWGHTERCPEEPMVDLMRRTMNGDGFLATTAGEIRRAAAAGSRYTVFDQLAMKSLTPLPQELPEADEAQVLLYSKRYTVLGAVGHRDDEALRKDVERLLHNIDLDRGAYETERWLDSRD